VSSFGEDDASIARSMMSESLFDMEDTLELQSTIDGIVGNKPLATVNFNGVSDEIREALGAGYEEVDLAPYMRQLSENVNKSLNGFLGRTAVYLLNNVLFDNGVFADSGDMQYNLIVNQVQERMEKSLTDFISIHVNDEAQKILRKIRLEN
jgi:hypothetical protein